MKSSYIYSKQILSFVKIIISFTRVNSFGRVFTNLSWWQIIILKILKLNDRIYLKKKGQYVYCFYIQYNIPNLGNCRTS